MKNNLHLLLITIGLVYAFSSIPRVENASEFELKLIKNLNQEMEEENNFI